MDAAAADAADAAALVVERSDGAGTVIVDVPAAESVVGTLALALEDTDVADAEEVVEVDALRSARSRDTTYVSVTITTPAALVEVELELLELEGAAELDEEGAVDELEEPDELEELAELAELAGRAAALELDGEELAELADELQSVMSFTRLTLPRLDTRCRRPGPAGSGCSLCHRQPPRS